MRVLADNALSIFTDGSAHQGPRVGGVAWRFVWTDANGQEQTDEGFTASWPGATNNEMELQAVIEALKVATGRHPIVDPSTYDKIAIYTDSGYVATNYPKALHEWSQKGWKLRGGGIPENLKQWRELMTLVRRVRSMRKFIEVEQIPRRSDEHSKRVDSLAKASAKSPLKARPLRPRNVTRKRSPNAVDPGCVPLCGQTERIRIIASWTVGSPHRGYRYKYEVISGENDQLVDLAVSEAIMHRSHEYEVRLNDQPGDARIVDVLREIDLDAERSQGVEPRT